MKENKSKLVQEWIQKANEDEKAGIILLKEKGPWSAACFHFQQMAEKYLKAYLVFKKKRFRKIHDLTEILKNCIQLDKGFLKLKENCEKLTPYGVATRYPGDFPEEISKEEAQKTFKMAREIKEFVLNKLKFLKF
jgi:HEPN domain-containing protein